MWYQRLMCSCVIAFLLKGVSSELQFRLSNTATGWNQAWTVCDRSKGSLAVLNSMELTEKFSKDVSPAQGEELWVGRYVGYSDLVWIFGCYGNLSLSRYIQETHVLEDNYLVTCLHACRTSRFIGMQGDLCFCIRDVPGDSSRVPGINCHSRCPGEVQEGDKSLESKGSQLSHCGRKAKFNSVSVYKRAVESEVNLNPAPGECVNYNMGTRTWQTDMCLQSMLFVCDQRDCKMTTAQCILESSSPSTWFDARAKCEGNDGLLSVINATTNTYFNGRNGNVNDVKFWTGLHRKEAILWIYDEMRVSTRPSERCVAVQKQTSGLWEYKTRPCDKNLRFVCIEDYQPLVSVPATNRPPPAQITDGEALPTVNPAALPVYVTAGVSGHNSASGLWVYISFIMPMLMTSLMTLV